MENYDDILGNINIRSGFDLSLRSLNKSFIEYTKIIRGVYLSKLFYIDSSGFFDTPSVDKLLQSVYSPPRRLFSQYSPTFVQTLTTSISMIQSEPVQYSSCVIDFFKEDISQIMQFSYCAFPVIFNYFTTDEYLTNAEEFLSEIIEKSSTNVSFELVYSMFLSATYFYDRLWNTFSALLSYPNLKDENLIKYLKKALLQTSSLLNQQYCNVLNRLITKHGDSAYCFVIKRLILEKFQLIFEKDRIQS